MTLACPSKASYCNFRMSETLGWVPTSLAIAALIGCGSDQAGTSQTPSGAGGSAAISASTNSSDGGPGSPTLGTISSGGMSATGTAGVTSTGTMSAGSM